MWLTLKTGPGGDEPRDFLLRRLDQTQFYWSVAPALVTFHLCGSWRCKPLAGLAFELLTAPATSKAPRQSRVFCLGPRAQQGFSSWENRSSLRTLTYLKVIPLGVETYGFLFQELSVTRQETQLGIPLPSLTPLSPGGREAALLQRSPGGFTSPLLPSGSLCLLFF